MRRILFLISFLFLLGEAAAAQKCDHPINIQVKGSISTDDVLKTTQPAIPKIQKCYKRFLEKNRNSSGNVTIISYVMPSGKVDSVEVCTSEKLANKALESCIISRMKKLTYPKGITPSEVQFPIGLNPE